MSAQQSSTFSSVPNGPLEEELAVCTESYWEKTFLFLIFLQNV